ncbi:MAG TPA: ATP-binding protein [Leptolyngbyaceae cyanobacterium]
MANLHKWLKFNSKINFLFEYRYYIQAGLTLCTGIGLSVVAFLAVYNWEHKFRQTEMQERLEKIASNIEGEIDGNSEVIRAVGALYNSSKKIRPQEFESFAKALLYRHPSLKEIAWLPVSEQNNRQYSHNQYAFSFNETERLLYLDLTALSAYKSALEKATVREEIIATSRIKLIKETYSKTNFLVFMPIYNRNKNITRFNKTNKSPLERPDLRGFILGRLEVEEIVRTSLQEVKLDSTDFYLEDLTAPLDERFLAFYEASTKRIITESAQVNKIKNNQQFYCRIGNACTRIINIENRRWLLRLLLPLNHNNAQHYWRSWLTLIFGIFLTSIVMIYLRRLLRYTEQIEKMIAERTQQSKQLSQALQQLKQAQAQLVQTEKMSALGQLVAGIAHEINNPVNFIYGNLHYVNQYTLNLLKLMNFYQDGYNDRDEKLQQYKEEMDFDFIIQDFPRLIHSMKIGADRIRDIVLSLKNFSRLDESEMKEVNLHDGIDNTLLILQTRLKARGNFPGIKIIKKYGTLPSIECYPSQLNQVFMNIIANSIDALESYYNTLSEQQKSGKEITITISSECSKPDYVCIRIADNGPGMTEEVKKRLFDPFFTTKPIGKGTGLGLSISYQIVVDKHNGLLWCESIPGQGTEFWIEIPVRQETKNLMFSI